VPVVLSRDEVRALLDALTGTPRLVAVLLYGSGLRLLEALGLRVKDLDFGTGEVVVRRGKGGTDRITMMPDSLREELAGQLSRVRLLHRRDLGSGGGCVPLPGAFHRKSPGAGREWAWQYVFPAREGTGIPRAGFGTGITCTSRWCSGR
jgi:integrase